MSEYRRSTVEVWALAADAAGIRLLSVDGEQGRWTPGDATLATWTQHEVVEDLLAAHGMPLVSDETHIVANPIGVTRVLHSTSWRPMLGRPWDVFTYVALVDAGQAAIDLWPGSRPVGRRLLEAVGRPYQHDPTEPPLPRYIDVCAHGIRHYRLLTNPHCDAFDEEVAAGVASLPGPETAFAGTAERPAPRSWWNVHLEGLRGQLAGLYRSEPGWRDGELVGVDHPAA